MSDLARELAQLQGWYRAEHIDPDGNGWNIWRNDEIGETVTDDEELPQPDTDPADAFNLLAYTLQRAIDGNHFWVSDMSQAVSGWRVELLADYLTSSVRFQVMGEGETLQQAIALACRDALVAIREAEGKQ